MTRCETGRGACSLGRSVCDQNPKRLAFVVPTSRKGREKCGTLIPAGAKAWFSFLVAFDAALKRRSSMAAIGVRGVRRLVVASAAEAAFLLYGPVRHD